MTYYTYAHYRLDDDLIFYIGKGTGDRYLRGKRRSAYWHNIADKHGWRSEILAEWTTEQEALNHEVFLIACFRDLGYPLVNISPGGEGLSGYKLTEESKAKMRKPKSQQAKDNMSAAKKLMYTTKPHHRKGVKSSPESIAKMKATKKAYFDNGGVGNRKGATLSKETIDKMKTSKRKSS